MRWREDPPNREFSTKLQISLEKSEKPEKNWNKTFREHVRTVSNSSK